MIFWEEENSKEMSKLTDDEWLDQEKKRELQMKKLMTVSKSKYYMLKVNFKKIFDEVDFELADNTNEENGFAKPADMDERLHNDLKRSDIDKTNMTSQQELLNKLKNPKYINVSETSENLLSDE
jgi:hypothetical protein